MTPLALLALSATVLATSFLAGIFGVAGGMILMGVLVAMLPVPLAMTLHGVAQIASNGSRALAWARYVDGRIVARYGLGLALALGLFALVRFVPDRALVLILLGLAPFVALAVPERLAPRVDRAGGAELCGLVGTALQLLSGVSGPTLDIFFVRTAMDRRHVVATKAACQVVTHLAKLVYFGGLSSDALGAVGAPALGLAVVFALVGTTLSRAVLERMTDAAFRRWTQRLVLGLGATFLALGVSAALRG